MNLKSSSKNKVDVLRDRSFGKRKKIMMSPDQNSKVLNASKSSIYDKVRKKVDNIVKIEKESQLFRKSADKYLSVKVFEKKRKPLVEDSLNEEESRELTITKDPIPKIVEKPEQGKEIYIRKTSIVPISFNKPPPATALTNMRPSDDSPLFKIKIDEIRDKLLSVPNDIKQNLSTIDGSNSGVKRRINFDLQSIAPFSHQIQSNYSSLYKSGTKDELQIGNSGNIINQKKKNKVLLATDNYLYNQNKYNGSSRMSLSEQSQNQIDEINSLKENKLRTKNEMKFLSLSIERLKKEISELNEDLNVSKFERDNAIAHYNKASMKIQDLHREVDGLQNKLQKTSSQFGELIDYLYRLNDNNHIQALEEIIGTESKQDLDDIRSKYASLTKQLAEVIDTVYLSRDKGLIDRINSIIKR